MGAHALRDQVFRANLALAARGPGARDVRERVGRGPRRGADGHQTERRAVSEADAVDIVLVSIETGQVVDSALRPSSDTPTHLELYRAFRCGGIVHTHSKFATAFAQAQAPIRCLGTTHADYFRGDVPVTRPMTEPEIATDYERNTGLVIVETFRTLGLSPAEVGAALVANHGPFVWSDDPDARRRGGSRARVPGGGQPRGAGVSTRRSPEPARFLVDKHYLRKHGAQAYYGQRTRSS